MVGKVLARPETEDRRAFTRHLNQIGKRNVATPGSVRANRPSPWPPDFARLFASSPSVAPFSSAAVQPSPPPSTAWVLFESGPIAAQEGGADSMDDRCRQRIHRTHHRARLCSSRRDPLSRSHRIRSWLFPRLACSLRGPQGLCSIVFSEESPTDE